MKDPEQERRRVGTRGSIQLFFQISGCRRCITRTRKHPLHCEQKIRENILTDSRTGAGIAFGNDSVFDLVYLNVFNAAVLQNFFETTHFRNFLRLERKIVHQANELIASQGPGECKTVNASRKQIV